MDALGDADPVLPPGAFNRFADNWRPLVAIADAVGGRWPAAARAALLADLAGAKDDALGHQLLEDVRTIFDTYVDADERTTPARKLASSTIVGGLIAMDDRPWARWASRRGRSRRTCSPACSRISRSHRTGRSDCRTGRPRRDTSARPSRTRGNVTSRQKGAIQLPQCHKPGFRGLPAICNTTTAKVWQLRIVGDPRKPPLVALWQLKRGFGREERKSNGIGDLRELCRRAAAAKGDEAVEAIFRRSGVRRINDVGSAAPGTGAARRDRSAARASRTLERS